jgi:Rod binding domain-containing protein
MSSTSLITPPVSLSELRGTQAAEKLKNTSTQHSSAEIQKSAKEFESVLLSHWLEEAQKSFATVPGSDQDPDADPGHDQFQSIAMQAVATAMSGNHGGLGIASMVAKHLEAAKANHLDPSNQLKIKGLHETPILVKPLGTPEVAK